MGGRGALSYILKYPDLFNAGAILSFVPEEFRSPDWAEKYRKRRDRISEIRQQNRICNAGGEEEYKKKTDYYSMILSMSAEGTLPRLFFACGDDDPLYAEEFRSFKAECEEKSIPIEFWRESGMKHEWRFWEDAIIKAHEFFNL